MKKLKIESLEDIKKSIFEASLTHNLNIQALGKTYAKLIQMRCGIIDVRAENNSSLEEVGEMWFGITEEILNVRIMIREESRLDISQENKKMEQLWSKSN